MNNSKSTKTQRAAIEDLAVAGTELSDEHLQLASGGLIIASYEAASSTFCNDTDWRRFD
jgi:hypothetical protein